MKKQVKIIILLLFGLAFLVYLFPFIFVEAAKLESGVTINAPSTTETEKICDDTIDNDNDGKVDAADEDCAGAPTGPAAGTCGPLTVSGVPINYGKLNLDQESAEQKVTIQNQGTSQTPAKIMIKGDDFLWFKPGSTETCCPRIFPSTITHVGITPNVDYNIKKPIGLSGLEVGQISSGQSIPVYFQIKAVSGAAYNSLTGFAGEHWQSVTIDLLC